MKSVIPPGGLLTVKPLLIVAALVATAWPAPAALADPPRSARIFDGRGMAGARIGGHAPLDRKGEPWRVTAGPLARWGAVNLGWCFEGSTCQWKVPGGGTVGAEIGATDDVITHLHTTSRRWRTRRGVHPGSSRARLMARYGRRPVITTCQVSPYGADFTGVAVPRGSRTTFFVLRGGRVDAIWIVGHRVTSGRC